MIEYMRLTRINSEQEEPLLYVKECLEEMAGRISHVTLLLLIITGLPNCGVLITVIFQLA